MITERQILELKKLAGDLRDKVIQAKATMVEIEANIKNYESELKSLGVKDIDNLDEEVKAIEEQIQKLYDEAYSKIEKYL